ncbi:MAG: hypothetical protein DWQ05_11570 [Calditrichaeota bacterium]|nr:MAG: hypothetical protein DWQ05_11570 [Calditrichota bacterium]
MKTQSIDTSPEAEKILISLIRKASLSKRIIQTLSLSQTTIQLSKRAIARANKELNAEQIKLLFIAYHYGEDLAVQIKKYLDKNQNEKF